MERVKLTAQEKQWRAQSDARTLMEAATISQDNARIRAARAEAAKVAKVASSAAGTKPRAKKKAK